jgi:hypothetical protein
MSRIVTDVKEFARKTGEYNAIEAPSRGLAIFVGNLRSANTDSRLVMLLVAYCQPTMFQLLENPLPSVCCC